MMAVSWPDCGLRLPLPSRLIEDAELLGTTSLPAEFARGSLRVNQFAARATILHDRSQHAIDEDHP
jgi:hypothetical protein